MKRFKNICVFIEGDKRSLIYHDLKKNNYISSGDDGEIVILKGNDRRVARELEKIYDKAILNKKIEKVENITNSVINYGVRIVGVILVGSVLLSGYTVAIKNNQPIITYITSDKESSDLSNLFIDSIYKNSTIKSDLRDELINALTHYINEVGNSDEAIYNNMEIANNIKKYDFSSEDKLTIEMLEKIFTFRNGKFIAHELYYHLNDCSYNNRYNELSNYINIFGYTKDVFLGKQLEISVKGKNYKINLDDVYHIDYLAISSLDKQVSDYLSSKGIVIRNVFSTNMKSNIFSDIFEIRVPTKNTSYYFKYNDGEFEDYTEEFYRTKFILFFYKNGREINLNNKDNRILLYFYAEALRLNGGFNGEDSSLNEFIYNSIFTKKGINLISENDLTEYLRTGIFNYDKVLEMWDIALLDGSTAFLQELNLALKIEVIEGNISKEDYDDFISMVVFVLEEFYPESLEEFKEANLFNRSLFEEPLKLIKNDSI